MGNRFTTPVELTVDAKVLTFNSLEEFEFCLDPRTEVPARKVAELLQKPLEHLREEARNIRGVERRFMQVLTDALDDPAVLGRDLNTLDRKLFSQDFRWRAIVMALDALGPERDDFRRAVMVRYVQYLRSRQFALREAYAEYKRREHVAVIPETEPDAANQGPLALRETAIFEVGEIEPREAGPKLKNLPRGQTVGVRLSAKVPVEILLSNHRFELIAGAPYTFRDSLGSEYSLRHGRNTVGRDVHNEIVVDPAFRDVSRKHLVIEPMAADFVQLTDLSSHGTSIAVPPDPMHQ